MRFADAVAEIFMKIFSSDFPPVKDLTPKRATGKRWVLQARILGSDRSDFCLPSRQTHPSVGEGNAKTLSRSPPKKKTKASDIESEGVVTTAS